jgi:very-short-patch-repair endonuclease
MTRTNVLQLAGFTVLHFTDEEVLNNLTQVQEKILGWIEEKGETKNLNTAASQTIPTSETA